MRILYYTSGVSGSGRIVQGISIYNALVRNKIPADYLLLSSSPLSLLAEREGVPHAEIPLENEHQLSAESWPDSQLYHFLDSFRPDFLLVDLLWFPLHHFIRRLSCRKVFLCHQVDEHFFSLKTPQNRISFQPGDYDLVLATEPFRSSIPLQPINPIVIRNRNEILGVEEARRRLQIEQSRSSCLFTFSGEAADVEEVKKTFTYLAEEGYQMVDADGLFPVVDYFNAFNLLICGAGYNSFWEAIFFQKKSYFIPRPRKFENQAYRVAECQDYQFEENGADQLVDLLRQI